MTDVAEPIDWADIEPPDHDAGDEPPPPEHDWPTGPDGRPLPARERHDDGNALRLVDAWHHRIRYCPDRRTWLTWTGHRWEWDHGGSRITELARRQARDLPNHDHGSTQWRKKSLMQPRINAMIGLAKDDPRIVVHPHQLDADAYALNTPAGVIDLRTGRLHEPTPEALHTRSTTTAPDFHAEPTGWLDFLSRTFAGEPELTAYVQRLLGLALIGEVLEQVFPFCYGLGANGKGTLVNVVQALLGTGDTGYAASAPAELIVATRFNAHPTEIARLAGARFVVTSETEEGQRFAEAKLKLLTGGDTLSGRFMGKDFFDFKPTHSLWLLANHQPKVKAGGHGLWRRMRLVPFNHIVPKVKIDPHLEQRLVETEGPAILAWMVAGALAVLRDGLADPAAVTAATSAYEMDQDTVARFVDARCRTGEPTNVALSSRSKPLYDLYTKWCAEEGEESVLQKPFTLALKTRYGVINDKTRAGIVLRGIRPIDLEDDGDDQVRDWTEPPDRGDQDPAPTPADPSHPDPQEELWQPPPSDRESPSDDQESQTEPKPWTW